MSLLHLLVKALSYSFINIFQSNNPDGDVWDTKGCMVVEDQGPPAGFAALGPLIDRSGGPHGHRHNLSALRQERVIGCHCNHTTNFAILMQTVEFQVICLKRDRDAKYAKTWLG